MCCQQTRGRLCSLHCRQKTSATQRKCTPQRGRESLVNLRRGPFLMFGETKPHYYRQGTEAAEQKPAWTQQQEEAREPARSSLHSILTTKGASECCCCCHSDRREREECCRRPYCEGLTSNKGCCPPGKPLPWSHHSRQLFFSHFRCAFRSFRFLPTRKSRPEVLHRAEPQA